ncbi:MAG: radical SAM family heme chaperone HemW [Bacteroidales bacterium]|nr:radical SAM family heme chaperone HemW [Bacteroidales bacterium]
MAGIYIHIPFCRQACRYCDFYFTVSLQYMDGYVSSLIKEIGERYGPGVDRDTTTLYFGGGTPSVLTEKQLGMIMEAVHRFHPLHSDAEVTIEVNPDDITREVLHKLHGLGFNRLSIGIQSFHEKDLQLMRRSHGGVQARRCPVEAREAGFDNISIDLIYGLPGLTLAEWEQNLTTAMELPVQHLSAYHLTYEAGTVFDHWRKKGRIAELPEQDSIDQYYLLREITALHGYEHYEISNFAKAGYRSGHNTSYWNGTEYLGFGPSAHSFNGKIRRWNTHSLKEYMEKAGSGESYHDSEILTSTDKYHDYLITALRRREGADIGHIRICFGDEVVADFRNKAKRFLTNGDLEVDEGRIRMTGAGWLKSDLVIGELLLG